MDVVQDVVWSIGTCLELWNMQSSAVKVALLRPFQEWHSNQSLCLCLQPGCPNHLVKLGCLWGCQLSVPGLLTAN
jgi:hypothetical protein